MNDEDINTSRYFVKVDTAGYVLQFIVSNIEQEGFQEIDYPIEQAPYSGYQFNINTKEWVDTRTPEQKYNEAAKVAITKRDALLYASDWTQIPNNPLTTEQQTSWAIYRQALRDITNQPGYPFDIVWPTKPT